MKQDIPVDEMNILFLAPRFHTNQADLARKLTEEGHRVSFLVMGQSQSEDHSVIEPFVVGPGRVGRLLNRVVNPTNDFARMASTAIPCVFRLYRGLIGAKPDVAIVRGAIAPYILLSLPYLFFRRTRIVIYTQGPQFREALSPRLRAFYWTAFRVCRFRWFTPVKWRGGPEGKHVTHSCMKFIPFFKRVHPGASRRTYNLSRPRFLAVGKFVERKNFLLLLEAFADLCRDYPIALTLIGECSTPQHRDYHARVLSWIQARGVQERVQVLTNTPPAFVQEQYLAHDVFIMPSVREPASIAQLEAMAHGLPVICSEDNGTAHYVRHGENGYIVRPTTEDLTRAMREVLCCPDKIRLFGQKSIEILETTFNIDSAYRQLVALME